VWDTKMNTEFWLESLKSDHLDILSAYGRVILKWIVNSGGGCWIHVARDRDQ
jgi:hypothetical protein